MTPLVLIDDNELVRNAVMRALSKTYAVIAFANPKDALRHLEALDYEPIIVCDYDMPELNGIEVFNQLDERFRTRFILHTGNVGVTSPSGVTLYKPATLESLRNTIRELRSP